MAVAIDPEELAAARVIENRRSAGGLQLCFARKVNGARRKQLAPDRRADLISTPDVAGYNSLSYPARLSATSGSFGLSVRRENIEPTSDIRGLQLQSALRRVYAFLGF